MHKNFLTSIKFLFAGVLAFMVLFTGSKAIAAPEYVGITAPRICTLPGKRGTLEIEMGYARAADGTPLPGLNLEEFPRTVDVGGVKFSAFDIRYKWLGINPSQTFISFPSDLTLQTITGSGFSIEDPLGSGDSVTGAGENAFEQVTVRFNSNEPTVLVTVTTDFTLAKNVTAGGHSGKFAEFCLIQGPGAAGQGFAQSDAPTFERIVAEDGREICVEGDPQTQCKKKVKCLNTDPTVPDGTPIEELFGVDGTPAVSFGVPNQGCPTFSADDGKENTRYYCSGGFCWAY